MKKSMITMALLFATFLGFNAFAQSQNTCPATGQTCIQQDSTCSKHKHHKGKKQRKKHNAHRGGMMVAFDALEGITLSDSQKAQIYDIQTKYKKAPAKGQRPDRDAMKQRHQDLITEIKAVLNADQVKQYEANLETMKKQVIRNNRNFPVRNSQQCCNPDSSICTRK